MADTFTAVQRSRIMAKVKGKDTKPEKVVRSLLHRLGFRFRLHRKDLPGRPDIVLPRHRKIIFVHGCFWHQHPNCPHAARPSSNTDYWKQKLDRNIARDAETLVKTKDMGWKVLVVWECQTRKDELPNLISDFLQDDCNRSSSKK